jgi:glutathione S-transferase
MSLQLFGHPFSSYTQKALIALYADATAFEFRMLDPDHAENGSEFAAAWPIGKFPLLVDGERTIPESTPIIEHLQAHHRGPHRWIPDGELGREVRLLDRIFDAYVMTPMQRIVGEALRPDDARDPHGLAQAHELLGRTYDWLEQRLPDHGWAAGGTFSLVECAAAPSLFYADWVQAIGDARPKLAAYRARLLAHPPVARCVDEARPYRTFFPLGAPDRD